MKIGAALVLLAVGAVLRFAIATSSTHGVNVHIIGDILMIVGALGLILWLIVWAPWARSRRSTYVAERSYPGRAPYAGRPLDDEEPGVVYRREERY